MRQASARADPGKKSGGLLGKGEEGGTRAWRGELDGHTSPEGEGATGDGAVKEAGAAVHSFRCGRSYLRSTTTWGAAAAGRLTPAAAFNY